ncbi:hypothetical protein SAMN05428989_4126 [Pseudoxanthomonas sp. GM95]|uniref:hypothetical protein n=1 Tax=Pseudoxanthomonas sp. GM95 TaxID=1881043 RepID=UPI0008CD4B4C|nr:hypothetical protein [Pseudoxanthomonas sp. GM95]SEM59496.1 hypothetical protein SAMN05428989_4126 [Pseudoxanthomonas sp. GM95]
MSEYSEAVAANFFFRLPSDVSFHVDTLCQQGLTEFEIVSFIMETYFGASSELRTPHLDRLRLEMREASPNPAKVATHRTMSLVVGYEHDAWQALLSDVLESYLPSDRQLLTLFEACLSYQIFSSEFARTLLARSGAPRRRF